MSFSSMIMSCKKLVCIKVWLQMLDSLYQHQLMTQNYIIKYNFIILIPSMIKNYLWGKKWILYLSEA